MNILFVSISSLPHMSEHSISLDLLREFKCNGHNVYVICAIESIDKTETYISEEDECKILRVKIGNNKRAGLIEKGITTVMLPKKYISAIKKYYSDVKFDLVIYPTPPVTHLKTVEYIKKRDNAKSYLLLKDIFPQNSVDLGMLKKRGIKGLIYKYFRAKEKKLYAISDRIGCMSGANVDYVLEHNKEIFPEKVEVCPNSIEPVDMRVSNKEKQEIREKYGLPLDKKIFVYGGNLGRPQDVPFIVECFKKCTDIKEAYFIVAGSGTDRHILEKYIENEKPINVKLFERMPKDEYDKMIACCDVGLIFLDHRFTIPNFPSRLLAYLQAGLPVLSCTDKNTDIGKVAVDGGFGWQCESDDVDKFYNTLKECLSSNIQKMSDIAWDYLNENYTVEIGYRIITEKEITKV